ncbi:antitoxin of toxin-antitoxin stability system [Sandaracinobacter sp. RS1-74]|uniref:antitoxin of toxin-antitoxin stability system n=1 Tax=Sandaracinobacteroides sayramensis TaxID=2913411 RepID=UPI001EDA799E|nr:antitoxin of toxin-antitoxin stability system [Sandaracinobacteroides sayramensis]MCG2841593.1 antitoxin of toxin-antitoxin stability system [Sandaracinobacteroides sayramensis]
MAKEAVFTMKLEADLRADFMAETESLHRPASQVVRELMREFVERQRHKRAHGLFVEQKVAVARESMQAGHGHDHDEVEADFAGRRARIADQA